MSVVEETVIFTLLWRFMGVAICKYAMKVLGKLQLIGFYRYTRMNG